MLGYAIFSHLQGWVGAHVDGCGCPVDHLDGEGIYLDWGRVCVAVGLEEMGDLWVHDTSRSCLGAPEAQVGEHLHGRTQLIAYLVSADWATAVHLKSFGQGRGRGNLISNVHKERGSLTILEG